MPKGGRYVPALPPRLLEALGPALDDLDELRNAVDAVRHEIRALFTMLAQQQQILSLLVDDRWPVPPRSPATTAPADVVAIRRQPPTESAQKHPFATSDG